MVGVTASTALDNTNSLILENLLHLNREDRSTCSYLLFFKVLRHVACTYFRRVKTFYCNYAGSSFPVNCKSEDSN